MSATLEDVAKQTGFSIATISRVVNGAEGVSADVRAVVGKAITELGYIAKRGRASQGNSERKERLIEVILHRRTTVEPIKASPGGVAIGPVTAATPEIMLSRSTDPNNDFYRTILDGILDELRTQGGKAVVQVVNDLAAPAVLNGLKDDLDGVLLVGEGGPALEAFSKGCRHPLVLVDVLQGAATHEVVTSDNAAGLGQAVEHLAQLGHRRVGYVSGVDDATGRERAAAFRFHAMRLGLDVPPAWQAVPYDSIAGTTERLLPMLSAPGCPTALACCNDWGALAVIRAAMLAGLRIPQDLSLVGFDDILIASLTQPPLTTIHVATAAIGRMAVRLVLTQRARLASGCTVRIPTHLIVRNSTAAAPTI